MYIGELSLEKLECHLYGYLSAIDIHNITEVNVPDFRHFYEWVTWNKNISCSIAGAKQITEKCKNEEESFELFFKLVEEFSQQTETLRRQFDFSKISKRSEEYCELNPHSQNEPIPTCIHIITLSSGNSYFIRSIYNNEIINSRSLYSDLDSVIYSINWEYGTELK